MINLVGQQFGNYRLARLLGRGGFADVYLGTQVYLGSSAAIKVLSEPLAQEAFTGFLAEARTLVGLSHPNIIRLLDFGVEREIPFLVMEYAPGGTLRERRAKGERLALSTVLRYVEQVAQALQYAHDLKIVHRDVKPANMLLGLRGEVLLGDFGIAVIGQQSSRQQVTQDVVGTVAYMAPEQMQGKPRKASDQYSLAVVVYEWMTGTPPFLGSFNEVAAGQCMAVPPPMRRAVPGITQELERVVMRGLAKRPEQRFPSVQTFATALSQAASRAADQAVLAGGEKAGSVRAWRLEDDFEGVSGT